MMLFLSPNHVCSSAVFSLSDISLLSVFINDNDDYDSDDNLMLI